MKVLERLLLVHLNKQTSTTTDVCSSSWGLSWRSSYLLCKWQMRWLWILSRTLISGYLSGGTTPSLSTWKLYNLRKLMSFSICSKMLHIFSKSVVENVVQPYVGAEVWRKQTNYWTQKPNNNFLDLWMIFFFYLGGCK